VLELCFRFNPSDLLSENEVVLLSGEASEKWYTGVPSMENIPSIYEPFQPLVAIVFKSLVLPRPSFP
jgi:hypothetical protein